MIFSSMIMAAVVGLPTLYFDIASWSRLIAMGYIILAMAVGGAIYFGLLWFTKAINKEDLKKLPVIGKKF